MYMAEYNITDSWRGGIMINFAADDFTQEVYEEVFDTDLISYSMAKSILEHGKETNEAIGIGLLNESFRDEIARRVIDGEYDGSVYGDSAEFYFETNIELPAGLELDDIKDTGGLEHIVNFLKDIEKTSSWGELNEYFYFEYGDIDCVSLNYTDLEDPVVGSISIDCKEAHIQNHVIEFTYDRCEDTFTFEPDNDAWQYFDDIADEIEQFIRDDLKEYDKDLTFEAECASKALSQLGYQEQNMFEAVYGTHPDDINFSNINSDFWNVVANIYEGNIHKLNDIEGKELNEDILCYEGTYYDMSSYDNTLGEALRDEYLNEGNSLASQIASAQDEKQEPSENKGISHQQEL